MVTLTTPQQFTLGVLGAAFLGLSTGGVAQASVLFNNGAPDFQTAVRSDFNFPVEAGDDFALSTNSAVSNITWSGFYSSSTTVSTDPVSDNFSVRIFSFVNNQPAIAPVFAFNNVNVQRSLNSQNTFFYDYSFAPTQPFTLNAGNYLLSVVNSTDTNQTLDWFWARSKQDGNDVGRFHPGDAWFKDGNEAELAFTINGTGIVPPPSPMPAPSPPSSVPTPVLLPGLIGFGLNLWRKRRCSVIDR